MSDFVVVIRSFERPRALLRLLQDIDRERPGGRFTVCVFDDGSKCDMSAPADFCSKRGWRFKPFGKNHGKVRAWEMFNYIFQWLKKLMRKQSLAVFLDDDMRLCADFFPRIRRAWGAMPGNRGVSLHLMVDTSRKGDSCWTAFKAKPVNNELVMTQWVDGSFVASHRFFELLRWKVNPIGADRWRHDPNLSTGVGRQLSQRMVKLQYRMFQVRQSLVVHSRGPSKMNPTLRDHNMLETADYIDGADQSAKLATEGHEPIEASLCSIPSRSDTLAAVVRALRPQVDVLRVYLNGYAKVPEWLHVADEVATSQEHGDRGDAGKFFWCEEAKGYQLTCDDDIQYPVGYAAAMVAAVERYDRRAAVGVHGVTLNETMLSYYKSRSTVHFQTELAADKPVHLVGTGCLAYHASAVKVRREDFKLPNMADIWFGILCQQQEVPVQAIRRPAEWLKTMVTKGPDIYGKHINDDGPQTKAVQDAGPWRIIT